MWTPVWILSLLLFHVVFTAADDDCNAATKLERMHGPFSDDKLTDGWYRVDETLELVHEEVEYRTCGTISPIWAKGEFPDDEDDVQDMEACVVSEKSSCNNTYEIKVKNCGKYYVYKLSPTRANEAFCFKKHDVDEDEDCEKQEDHSKRFNRCNRENRNVVLVIGTVIICIVIVSIVGVCFWKHRRNEAIRRKEGLVYKEDPQRGNEPVVVVTDGALPPKKY